MYPFYYKKPIRWIHNIHKPDVYLYLLTDATLTIKQIIDLTLIRHKFQPNNGTY